MKSRATSPPSILRLVKYRFLGIPFGLKMSQDVFQSKIDQLMEGCVGMTGIAVDMIVYAKTEEEHNRRLHGLMRCCAEKGLNLNQGSKKLFFASRRIFRTEPGGHFSGRIFFQLGRNRVPRLKSLGAKKKKEAIFEVSFCLHSNTNIINEMIASSFFLQ